MNLILITAIIVFMINLYLFLFGGLTDVIAVSSIMLIIGMIAGKLSVKLEEYDDEEYVDEED